jgi:hypothetical protein
MKKKERRKGDRWRQTLAFQELTFGPFNRVHETDGYTIPDNLNLHDREQTNLTKEEQALIEALGCDKIITIMEE